MPGRTFSTGGNTLRSHASFCAVPVTVNTAGTVIEPLCEMPKRAPGRDGQGEWSTAWVSRTARVHSICWGAPTLTRQALRGFPVRNRGCGRRPVRRTSRDPLSARQGTPWVSKEPAASLCATQVELSVSNWLPITVSCNARHWGSTLWCMGDAEGRRSQLLRGVLDLCLLAVMDEGPAYGYEMTKRLRARGLSIVGEGSIYPVLGRLERDGLVETRRAASNGGPPRKYYSLSPDGERALEAGVRRMGGGARRRRWCPRSGPSGGDAVNEIRRGVSAGVASPRSPGSDRERDGGRPDG